MAGTQRSRSALGVAAEREVLTQLGVISDPYARRMLAPPAAAACSVAVLVPLWRARAVTLAGLAARVLWFDAQVASALDAGVTQVVIVGGGYDSRAWRMHRDGVQFFELDHPATQQDKVLRAPGVGPRYVAADLTDESAADALAAHGLDAARPALFVVEGVTMYLDETVVRDQFTGLAKASATGSRLTADFVPPADTGTKRNRRQDWLQRLARSGSGETLKLRIDRAAAVALIEDAGWTVEEATSVRDAARALVPSESRLPVNAINEHKTLVAAARS
jgi:methyltransferase (TIGR00027 family)